MLPLQIEVLHRKQEPIPTGWAVNKEGKVSDLMMMVTFDTMYYLNIIAGTLQIARQFCICINIGGEN